MSEKVYGPDDFFVPSAAVTQVLLYAYNQERKGENDWGFLDSIEQFLFRSRIVRECQKTLGERCYRMLASFANHPVDKTSDISPFLNNALHHQQGVGTLANWTTVVDELCKWVEEREGQVKTHWGIITYKNSCLSVWSVKDQKE